MLCSDPANYRMLAVNGVLYRLYANVVREVVTQWCVQEGGKVPDNQFAFYPGRCAQQPMFILRHIYHASKGRGPVHLAFIDFKQAYDTIDRGMLWDHLREKVHLPGPLLAAIQGLYQSDQYILVDGSKRTQAVHPNTGVKQGCPLSPLLFALYVNDFNSSLLAHGGVSRELDGGAVRITREGSDPLTLTHLFYADDLVLLARSTHLMEAMLRSLSEYAERKGLQVNAGKSCVMHWRWGRLRGAAPKFEYRGGPLKEVQEFRYLGLVFTTACSMDHAAEQWAGPLMGGIKGCFKTAGALGARHMPHVVLRLFQTYAHSYGMYGSQVWGTAMLQQARVFTSTVQKRHTGFLRFLAHTKRSVSNDVMMCEMCQLPYQFYWWRCVLKFWNSMVSVDNPLIKAVVRADVELSNSAQGCWVRQVRDASSEHGWSEVVNSLNSLAKVDVTPVMHKWKAWFATRLGAATGDPALAQCVKRRLCTYNRYFKKQALGSWWQLPEHLTSGLKLHRDVVRSMTRFRVSSHSLGVETGRYNGTAFEQRICQRCEAQGRGEHVDTETHLVFDCVTSEALRGHKFASLFENVAHGDLRRFMQAKNHRELAKFVHVCMSSVDEWGATAAGMQG